MNLWKITNVQIEKHGQEYFNWEVTIPSAFLIASALCFKERRRAGTKGKKRISRNNTGERGETARSYSVALGFFPLLMGIRRQHRKQLGGKILGLGAKKNTRTWRGHTFLNIDRDTAAWPSPGILATACRRLSKRRLQKREGRRGWDKVGGHMIADLRQSLQCSWPSPKAHIWETKWFW